MTEWCTFATLGEFVPKGQLSPKQKAELAQTASEIILGTKPPMKRYAYRKIADNSRHQEAIGFMGWALGEVTGRISTLRLLERLDKIQPGCREYKYLKTYLPIDAYYVDEKKGGKTAYLSIVMKNLPAAVRKMKIKDQAAFILLAMALMHRETKFNPGKISEVGAKGLMQIMEKTAAGIVKEFMPEEARSGRSIRSLLLDPETNIKIGLFFVYRALSKRGNLAVTEDNIIEICRDDYNPGHATYPREVLATYRLYVKLYSDQLRDQLFTDMVRPLAPSFLMGFVPPIVKKLLD